MGGEMEDNKISSIGHRIESCMKDNDLRQVDISKSIGASRGSVSKWISGNAKPSYEYILRLSEVFNVPPGWLEEGDEYYNFNYRFGPDDAEMYIKSVEESFRDSYLSCLKLKPNLPYSISYLKELYEEQFISLDDKQDLIESFEKESEHWENMQLEDPLQQINDSDEARKLLTNIADTAGADIKMTIYITVEDDSMYPLIAPKANCAIDKSKRNIKDGKIYYFKQGKIYRIKYLYKQPDGGLLIRSKNDLFKDEIVKASDMQDISIIGWIYSWTNIDIW
jgi:transcriptional regulator with XRE-family HTH domain